MNDLHRRRGREIQDAIRQVLYRDWDPIGVGGTGPKDEYDFCIGPVYRLLLLRPPRETVMVELRKLADGELGVNASEKAVTTAAVKLLEIDLRLE